MSLFDRLTVEQKAKLNEKEKDLPATVKVIREELNKYHSLGQMSVSTAFSFYLIIKNNKSFELSEFLDMVQPWKPE